MEAFMKEHRRAFEGSSAQVACRLFDRDRNKFNATQISQRQSTRFNSMLNEQYGGRKAVLTFLRNGRLVDVRLPPLPENHKPRDPPQRRSKATAKNEKYFAKLYEDLVHNVREGRTTRQWYIFEEQVVAGSAQLVLPPNPSAHTKRTASWLGEMRARHRKMQ